MKRVYVLEFGQHIDSDEYGIYGVFESESEAEAKGDELVLSNKNDYWTSIVTDYAFYKKEIE